MKSLLPQLHPTSVLGIDVQSRGIHLVEVMRDPAGAVRLQNCAWAPLEPGWVVQGHILEFEGVSQRLRDLVRGSALKARRAVLGMPSRSVTTYRVSVPTSAGEDDVSRAVEVSLASRVGERPQDWVVDYCDSNPTVKAGDSPTREVMVALSRRDRIHDRLGLAESAGVQVMAIDLETQACEAAWKTLRTSPSDADHATSIVLLHLDDEGIQAMACIDGVVCAESVLSWSHAQTSLLMDPTFESKVHLVSQWLRTPQQWTWPQSDRVWTELPHWDVLYLTGRVPQHEPWADQLSVLLGIQVKLLNPLQASDGEPAQPSITGSQEDTYVPEFFKAFGLAVQGTLQ